MPDYQLTGLNTRAFEHMIQALGLQAIGQLLTPFGDGRDGGREATYEGRMSYPHEGDTWDGYLVVQCKFRQRPTARKSDAKDGAPADDQNDTDWAIKALRDDLEKFVDESRDLRKPEYYLFVTNVILSAVPTTGGIDRVKAVLAEYVERLGLKGYDVWEHEKINRLLDSNADVRSAYGHFITPGDVLEAMKARLTLEVAPDQERIEENFWDVLRLFLQSELRADQFARLEQAGHTTDQKIALANVFVDIAVSDQPVSDPPDESEEAPLIGVVESLVRAGSEPLRANLGSVSSSHSGDDERRGSTKPQRGRFVLIGGPGQGKSTVTQFLSQLYRAALLADVPSQRLAPETREALALFRQQCEDNDLHLPQARRFPLPVSLPQFAKALAQEEVSTLMDFLAFRLKKGSGRDVDLQSLRLWLQTYPWLLVFDGLDEVPATSNRAEVMAAIHLFTTEISDLDADVLIVATTRPQGYEHEFDERFYKHSYLAPLSSFRVLRYSKRLVDNRHRTDIERRDLIFKRLQDACGNPTTLRLMRSPLQVTIMATLVEHGPPPQERWKLFSEYYRVIYKRELEREIPASLVLREQDKHVTVIHQRAGLLLQTESELPGRTESLLSQERLMEIIRGRLSEEGCAPGELEARVQEISSAALERLVFLVGLQEGQIGFEIRSLQEFMAAEALTSGNERSVAIRLEAIAPISHWRNVFLFAAGRIFEEEHQRDTIVGLCEKLNSPDSEEDEGLNAATLTGSRLALDILEDGLTRSSYKYKIILVRLALRLLELPNDSAPVRLANCYEEGLSELYQSALRSRLALIGSSQSTFDEHRSAWVVLKLLVDRGVEWASQLSDEYWPQSSTLRWAILRTIGDHIPRSWYAEKFYSVLAATDVNLCQNFVRASRHRVFFHADGRFFSALQDEQMPEEAKILIKICQQSQSLSEFKIAKTKEVANNEETDDEKNSENFSLRLGLRTLVNSQSDALLRLKDLPDKLEDGTPLHSQWLLLRAAAKFISDPEALTLAEALEEIATRCVWDDLSRPTLDTRPLSYLPWPLAACLNSADSSEELRALATRAREGDFGDVQEWQRAEMRWEKGVVTLEECNFFQGKSWPFDARISDYGFPLVGATDCLGTGTLSGIWEFLAKCYEDSSDEQARRQWATLAARFAAVLSSHNIEISLTPEIVRDIWRDQKGVGFPLSLLHQVQLPQQRGQEWLDILNELGLADREQRLMLLLDRNNKTLWKGCDYLALNYAADPQRYNGIASILSALALDGTHCKISPEALNHNAQKTEEILENAWLKISNGVQKIDAVALGKQIAHLAPEVQVESGELESNVIDLTISMLLASWDEREEFRDADQAFVMALNRNLESLHHMGRSHTIGYLLHALGRQKSTLVKDQNWNELSLPALPLLLR